VALFFVLFSKGVCFVDVRIAIAEIFFFQSPGGGYLGKIGAGYVRAIRVPFFDPQKSLKGVQIQKLVSERVPKSRKSKISLSKGHDFQKF